MKKVGANLGIAEAKFRSEKHRNDNNLHVIKRSSISYVGGAQFQLAWILYLTVDRHNWVQITSRVIAKASICYHPVGHEIITHTLSRPSTNELTTFLLKCSSSPDKHVILYFLVAYVLLFTFLPIRRRSEPGFCVNSHRCANGKIQLASLASIWL